MERSQKIRYALYSAAVTVAFMIVLDGVVTWLETRGDLNTGRAGDSNVLTVDPWIEHDGALIPNPNLPSRMVHHRLRVTKGHTYRVFLLGASFLKGVPFEGPGTIHHQLTGLLKAALPGRTVEVANASMSGVDSGLVAQAAAYAMNHEPNSIVVATCNNEGTLPPSKVTARLHELGTFRLFRKVLRPDPTERPIHTPQDPDQEAVADNFRNNLESIVEAARTAGVPVILCTLPLNLLYDGDEAGIPLGGHAFETPGSVEHPPCVKAGIKRYRARQYKEAIASLRTCEEVESLRWIGLAQFATGDTDAARATLEGYTELIPRNRCRPSFQAIIRDVAAKSADVTLVDLDTLFRSRGTAQIAGSEHFTDYCHLTKEAQGIVAQAISGALTPPKKLEK